MDFCVHTCFHCQEPVSHYRTGCSEPSMVVGFHTDCTQPFYTPTVLSITPERTALVAAAAERLQEAVAEALAGPKPPDLTAWGLAREDD